MVRTLKPGVQLSNVDGLAAYIFGGRSASGNLPVGRSFKTEVIGDAADSLRAVVREHGAWLRRNCERQLENYRCKLQIGIFLDLKDHLNV